MTEHIQLTHRIATRDDMPAILELMQLAIAKNMKEFLIASIVHLAIFAMPNSELNLSHNRLGNIRHRF